MASQLPLSQRAAPLKPSPAPIVVLPKGLPPSYAAQIPARYWRTISRPHRGAPQAMILSPLCRGVSGAGRPVCRRGRSWPWAMSLDFTVAAAHSATALRALTADCTQSASVVSCAASASHFPQDHGPVASTSSTTAMPTLPGMCTGLRLCDTSRSSKRVRTCA
ncbi:hypothetical protein TRIUR3_32578 [Triticum urartu]|uniref:Uncharacterized protein n=1 Tax=Triticum urartu TaxID=4572 RepID=M8A683_TRIUA|nr:uncharacterized protein LOC125508325 [Triticum urartu]EMS55939.1 hypothetical protein TRIUR3_32578 [Triticum urartu]